jgi:hypothetical protein
MQTFVSGLVTLGEAILVALAVPIAILAVGLPVVLVVRLAVEAARMW